MAVEKRAHKKRRIRYFFINVDGEPHVHKVIQINKAADTMMAWDYPDHKRKMYSYSDVRKTMQHAYSTKEVCEILNMNRYTVHEYIYAGKIKRPARLYSLQTNREIGYMFSEDDILDLHQAQAETHRGRPRKDGLITARKDLPDRATVKALVQQQQLVYTLDQDGNPIPLWKEQVW